MAARGGTAALVGTGCAASIPLVHHVRGDGSAILLLSDDEPLLSRLREGGPARCPGVVPSDDRRGELAVMLELTDRAPVDLREPVRGLLWIMGWLWLPDRAAARRMALQVADVHPQDRLLDLGHGATLVRLDPGSAVLSDGDGSAALRPVDLAAARPDPFCCMEDQWLNHLEDAHPEVVLALTRHLPLTLRGRGARVRPLGVDRFGLRLRVEAPDTDHDVRLAFPTPAATPEELREQVSQLVACPIASRARPGPPAPGA